MKTTPLTTLHRALGARMAEFAGYDMPVEYAGVIAEHLCVCKNVGIFDVSHMGEFVMKGRRAFELLQFLTSNDVSVLPSCKAQYSCLMNQDGGVVDDIIAYCREPQNNYLVVVNAANIDKDYAHFVRYAPKFGVTIGSELCNISDYIAQIAVQGTKAMELLQNVVQQPILQMQNYTFMDVDIPTIGRAIFATTGYTGAGGGELYVDTRHVDAAKLWNLLLTQPPEFGTMPIGLGARDTLRLEMGYCLYGHELTDTTTPLEANLGWITKFNHEFIGVEVLQQQKLDGPSKKLVALRMTERGIPRSGYDICNSSGTKIGVVTSGSMSPLTKENIGLGYVSIENAGVGTTIFVRIREKLLSAEVVKLPFRKM